MLRRRLALMIILLIRKDVNIHCQDTDDDDPFYPNVTMSIVGDLEVGSVRFMIDGIINNDTYIITATAVIQVEMTDKTKIVRVVAGSSKTNGTGYREGVGNQARFKDLAGAAWLNSTHLVVTDKTTNCLRLVEEQIGTTSRYTGHCDIFPEQQNIDGSLDEARFRHPEGILSLNDTLYFAMPTGILKISEGFVSTLTSGTLLKHSHYITSLNEMLYVTTWSGVVRVDPTTGRSSAFTRSFDYFTSIVAIEGLQLLVISSTASRQFKVVELKNYNNIHDHKRYNICTGSLDDWGYKVGTAEKCVFRSPESLMVRGNVVYTHSFNKLFKMTFEKPKPIELLYLALGLIAGLPLLVVIISVIVIICRRYRS